jgi:hypothetical protein
MAEATQLMHDIVDTIINYIKDKDQAQPLLLCAICTANQLQELQALNHKHHATGLETNQPTVSSPLLSANRMRKNAKKALKQAKELEEQNKSESPSDKPTATLAETGTKPKAPLTDKQSRRQQKKERHTRMQLLRDQKAEQQQPNLPQGRDKNWHATFNAKFNKLMQMAEQIETPEGRQRVLDKAAAAASVAGKH